MNDSFFDIIQKLVVNYPGISVFKSSDLVYIGCNQYTASITGFNNPASFIGKTDYDVKCEAVKFAEKFRSQDKKIIEKKFSSTYIDINHYKNGPRILLTERKCLQNSKGDVFGVFCHGTDITHNFGWIDYLKSRGIITFNNYKMQPKTLELIDGFNVRLNKEENMCLFYMLQYKSEKEVSKFMNLSQRKLSELIVRIVEVMDCVSFIQVIEKAISLNYLDLLPKELVKGYLIPI